MAVSKEDRMQNRGIDNGLVPGSSDFAVREDFAKKYSSQQEDGHGYQIKGEPEE